jgi:DNA-binding GntR family transcriptional regulator
VKPLTPIRTPYLRETAFVRLREAIVTGALAPGAPIVINDLAAQLDLSTMPAREAVKRLVAEGLIEETQRRSHRVAELTRASALNVLDVMGPLMERAYAVAVPALTQADIAAMREHLTAASVAAGAGDLLAALYAIHAIHNVVYERTGNPEFGRTLSTITPRFDRVLYLWYTESIVNVGSSYRRELIESLEQGQPDTAISTMREAWDRFRTVISHRADQGTPA